MISLLICSCHIPCPHHLWFDYPNIRRGDAFTKLYEAFHYAMFLILMLFSPSYVQISYSTPCSRKWFVHVLLVMWQAKLHLHVKQPQNSNPRYQGRKGRPEIGFIANSTKMVDQRKKKKNVRTEGGLTDFIIITRVVSIRSHSWCQWKRMTQSITYSTWVLHSSSSFGWSIWIFLARSTGSCLIYFVVSCPSHALYFAWWLRCRASILTYLLHGAESFLRS
jgi:hypothetical protein